MTIDLTHNEDTSMKVVMHGEVVGSVVRWTTEHRMSLTDDSTWLRVEIRLTRPAAELYQSRAHQLLQESRQISVPVPIPVPIDLRPVDLA